MLIWRKVNSFKRCLIENRDSSEPNQLCFTEFCAALIIGSARELYGVAELKSIIANLSVWLVSLSDVCVRQFALLREKVSKAHTTINLLKRSR